MNLWRVLFPIRRSIQSQNPSGLTLEVNYFGFIKIVGIYVDRRVNCFTWVTAKRVFNQEPNLPIKAGGLLFVRYEEAPQVIRVFGIPDTNNMRFLFDISSDNSR